MINYIPYGVYFARPPTLRIWLEAKLSRRWQRQWTWCRTCQCKVMCKNCHWTYFL